MSAPCSTVASFLLSCLKPKEPHRCSNTDQLALESSIGSGFRRVSKHDAQVTSEKGIVVIRSARGPGSAMVVIPDLAACNTVVHVVDHMLLPTLVSRNMEKLL